MSNLVRNAIQIVYNVACDIRNSLSDGYDKSKGNVPALLGPIEPKSALEDPKDFNLTVQFITRKVPIAKVETAKKEVGKTLKQCVDNIEFNCEQLCKWSTDPVFLQAAKKNRDEQRKLLNDFVKTERTFEENMASAEGFSFIYPNLVNDSENPFHSGFKFKPAEPSKVLQLEPSKKGKKRKGTQLVLAVPIAKKNSSRVVELPSDDEEPANEKPTKKSGGVGGKSKSSSKKSGGRKR